MNADGFPHAVAVALGIAFAFAVSLFAAFAFGGIPFTDRRDTTTCLASPIRHCPPSGATFSFGRLPRSQLTAMCIKKSPGSDVRGYQLDYLLHHIFEPFWVRFVMYNFLWCLVA
jgi:hypothetical protein